MGKIVAIGGGEIGRPGFPVETLAIDRRIIELTGKKRPKLLFIPTASSDSEVYVATVQKHFGERLGCHVDVLYLVKKKTPLKLIRKKISNADVIYVGGGNTLKMMSLWRKQGVDKFLQQAHQKGTILTGISAGAICWFKHGSSDSRQKGSRDKRLIRVRGIGIVNATLSPHHLCEKNRKQGIIDIMSRTFGIAIALDDYCAIEILDDRYRLIASKPFAGAHKVYFKKGKAHYESVAKTKKHQPLKHLLQK